MKTRQTLLYSVCAPALLSLGACSQTSNTSSTSSPSLTVASTTSASTSTDANTDYFTETDLTPTYGESSVSTIKLLDSSTKVSGNGVSVDGSTVTISEAGTYIVSGESDGVRIKVTATDSDKVQIVLNGVTMTGNDALIAVTSADKVVTTSADGTTNTLTDSEHITDDRSAATYSKSDLTFSGSGTLTVEGNYNNAIKGSDDVKFTGGTHNITPTVKHAISVNDAIDIYNSTPNLTSTEDAIHSDNDEDTSLGNIYIRSGDVTTNAGGDGIHASNDFAIDGGTIDVQSRVEGLEGRTITINDSTISINASDDDINATDWAFTGDEVEAQDDALITANGRDIATNMADGDTDGIDSDGNLVINGGTINATGQSAFDFNGNVTYNGGALIVNDETETEITESGPGAGGGPGGF